MNDDLLEIRSFDGQGYSPLIRSSGWRVAELRYCDELLPENIAKLQRHDVTDEIFVLLAGKCVLLLGGGTSEPGEITALPLCPLKIYNVRKGTWHSHTLSRDAAVLIFENDDTCDENSPEHALGPEQRERLVALCREALRNSASEG